MQDLNFLHSTLITGLKLLFELRIKYKSSNDDRLIS